MVALLLFCYDCNLLTCHYVHYFVLDLGGTTAYAPDYRCLHCFTQLAVRVRGGG